MNGLAVVNVVAPEVQALCGITHGMQIGWALNLRPVSTRAEARREKSRLSLHARFKSMVGNETHVTVYSTSALGVHAYKGGLGPLGGRGRNLTGGKLKPPEQLCSRH